MAAPVHSIQVALNCPRRPLKKTTCSTECNFIISQPEEKQKFFLSGKANTKPRFGKSRGAPKRAERNGFPLTKTLGGHFSRPRFRREKRKKFYRCVSLRRS